MVLLLKGGEGKEKELEMFPLECGPPGVPGLAQSVKHVTLNLKVVTSSPTMGVEIA